MRGSSRDNNKKKPRQDFPQKENHLLLSCRMNEPSGYAVTSSALATCFALLRHCRMHLLESRSMSRIPCKKHGVRLKKNICRIAFIPIGAHLHHLQSIRDSRRLLGGIKAGFTSQFLYISISFMETVFHANKIQMCSLTPSFQQPTARDLILKTFGGVKHMPSYKM